MQLLPIERFNISFVFQLTSALGNPQNIAMAIPTIGKKSPFTTATSVLDVLIFLKPSLQMLLILLV